MTIDPHSIVREPTVTILSRPQFAEAPHLPVQWSGIATDGERLTEYAGRLRQVSQHNPAERSTQSFLENVLRDDTDSLLHHATYSLLVEGVSHAAASELQRWAGLHCTGRAQRYVEAKAIRFVLPPAIIGDAQLERAWSDEVRSALARYVSLTEDLLSRFAWVGDTVQRRKLAREAAGSVLPLSTEQALIATGSITTWRALIVNHGSERGALEMRRVSIALLHELRRLIPACLGDLSVAQASDRREYVRGTPHTV